MDKGLCVTGLHVSAKGYWKRKSIAVCDAFSFFVHKNSRSHKSYLQKAKKRNEAPKERKNMEEFYTKTNVCFGTDALQFLKQWNGERIFIVTDPFLVESGMIERITGQLSGKQYQIFSHVVPDPPLELVVEGIREVSAYQPDTLLAVGGGSAIDEGKAIMHFSKRLVSGIHMRFIAVPTTSGTGSEVTSFAVITDTDKGIKYPLVDEGLLPDVAILDPALVKSVPAAIVADTGMDVLTHALEAYVSAKANAFTDALAETAALTVLKFLTRSYENKEDAEARERMHSASCMAGMAFDKASLGLNHAIAHNIGGKFHVPHGRTNAVLLPHVMEFNAGLTDYQQKEFSLAARKYADLASMAGLGGMNIRTSVKNLIQQIKKMQKQMKMPVSFRECGIEADAYQREEEALIAGAQGDACIASNPRSVSRQDIQGILRRSY